MIKRTKSTSLLILTLFALIACSQAPKTNSSKSRLATTSYETGKASYYADKYQGRQTASGERFKQSALTAAHKTLAFGTRVRVINPRNGRSVIVRINDRGPFVKGRIIDLSKSAFKLIEDQRFGVVNVIVEGL